MNGNGRKIMPVSITVHHAIADGYHVGLFLDKFQEYMNYPEKWMKQNSDKGFYNKVIKKLA